jgi:hypothetical protein
MERDHNNLGTQNMLYGSVCVRCFQQGSINADAGSEKGLREVKGKF